MGNFEVGRRIFMLQGSMSIVEREWPIKRTELGLTFEGPFFFPFS